MLKVRRSKAISGNGNLKKVPREPGENNLAWFSRHIATQEDITNLILVGGSSPAAFRLRVAQSHARQDFVPSSWSHVALLGKAGDQPGAIPLMEITLAQESGDGFPPKTNGVQEHRLGRYEDPILFPNVAVLQVHVPLAQAWSAGSSFRDQRTVIDALELVLAWQAFTWGVGRSPNPLMDGLGIPSAVFVESAIAGAGKDLVPGLPSRASSPEMIWQSAKWWHDQAISGQVPHITGTYFKPHEY